MDDSFLVKALDTGAAQVKPVQLPNMTPFVVVPQNYTAIGLEKFGLKPARIHQTVKVSDPESFSSYFTAYSNAASRIFVDKVKPAIFAVIDYHGQGSTPEWGGHGIQYDFRPTIEWSTWIKSNKVDMSQAAFAEFIEDNLPDIISPESALMLEISRTLEAKKNVNFSSAVRLSNREVQFTYEEEIKGTAAKGTIDIPESFDIAIAPFEGSPRYRVKARFRYKIGSDGVKLRYELLRPHEPMRNAVEDIVTAIQAVITANPITFGSLA